MQVLTQLKYALVTGNHIMLEGPPGVAKSYLANKFFSAIDGGTKFKVQCTKKMTEDYIVGPLDMHLFREQGEYVHRVEGYLPTATYAFLDEFLDLSTGALRALLEILNERTFSRGPQAIKCPLITAIVATNFSGESEMPLEAVLDRFLFKAKISGMTRKEDRRAMFAADSVVVPKFSHEDVRRIISASKRVIVPAQVLDTYLEIVAQLKVTDRTVRRCLDVVRASAVLGGRSIAVLEDVASLDTCFIMTGEPKSEQAFSHAMKQYAVARNSRDVLVGASVLSARVSQLHSMMSAAATYAAAYPLAYEIREAQAAATSLSSASIPGLNPMISGILHKCESALNRADTLYANERPTP